MHLPSTDVENKSCICNLRQPEIVQVLRKDINIKCTWLNTIMQIGKQRCWGFCKRIDLTRFNIWVRMFLLLFSGVPEPKLCQNDSKPLATYVTTTETRLGLEASLDLTPSPLKPQATMVPDINLGNDLKRLGSPCSNSSDSGLSDINASMSTNGSGSDHSDPLRPRIWSLAHVATSTAGMVPSMMEHKDQNSNLTTLKPSSNPMNAMSMSSAGYSQTNGAGGLGGGTLRPWIDSSFNVGSSLFSPMSAGYQTLGTQRPRESPSSMVNQSLNSLNGLSSPNLSRPYPSLSSLYTPVRDLSKPRNLDAMPDMR